MPRRAIFLYGSCEYTTDSFTLWPLCLGLHIPTSLGRKDDDGEAMLRGR